MGENMNKTDVTAAFEQSSFLYGGNAKFIEDLYSKFKANPAAVDTHWRQFFSEIENGTKPGTIVGTRQLAACAR